MSSIVFRISGSQAVDEHAEAGRMVEQHDERSVTYGIHINVKPKP